MAYTLNDYYPLAENSSTRVEVYSSNGVAAHLLAYHKKCGAMELSLGDCVSESAVSLPMPSELMPRIDCKIAAASNRVIVTGIDAYLSLLGEQGIKAFMTALKTRIDAGKINAVFMMCCSHFDYVKFTNPKYENDLYIALIGDESQYFNVPVISVVSDKWLRQDNNPRNWHTLLKLLGQFEPTGEYTLVLSGYDRIQSGLADNVIQAADVGEVARRYYKIEEILPQNVLEHVFIGCKEQNTTPLDWLKNKFGEANLNTRMAVKRLRELRDDLIWTAYLWLLRALISHDSYLGKAMYSDVSADQLLRLYVCDAVISMLSDEKAEDFSAERAEAIRELNGEADSLIIEFIDKTKNYPSDAVACWLNCHTEAERIEIVRRVSESDLTVGLPAVWQGLYPLLSEYLSDNYDYGNSDITAYFRDYRRLKVRDTVTEEFVRRAYNTALPASLAMRDVVLGDFSADTGTALLVVDGMGAEYFPLLCGIASRKSMNIESAIVAAVHLPSSTEFNHIVWNNERVLRPEIREVDNISHNGAVKNQNCTPAQNIVATFAVFETVINRVAEAFAQYERVVVTADHGSSRLAVIAHEEKMDKTLSWKGTPDDWRYSAVPDNAERPEGFEPYYHAENNITYWIVRGYNRLPKKGGKLSVHGGATLEERLVPVVVFSKAKSINASKHIGKKTAEQLVDKMGFDI